MVYDWAGKREICYQMYIQEKKPLEEIMEYMRTAYQFAPRYVPIHFIWIAPIELTLLVNALFKPSSNDGTFPPSKIQHTKMSTSSGA